MAEMRVVTSFRPLAGVSLNHGIEVDDRRAAFSSPRGGELKYTLNIGGKQDDSFRPLAGVS